MFFQILARTAFSSICKNSKKAYHFSSVSGTKEPIIKGRSRKKFHISQAVSYTLKELREVTFKILSLLVLSMVEYENVWMMSFNSSKLKYWALTRWTITFVTRSTPNPSKRSCAKSGGSPTVTWKKLSECKHESLLMPYKKE